MVVLIGAAKGSNSIAIGSIRKLTAKNVVSLVIDVSLMWIILTVTITIMILAISRLFAPTVTDLKLG